MATHEKKHKKNNGNLKKEMPFAEEGQFYAKIENSLGDGRFQIVLLKNNISAAATLKGSLRKGRHKQIVRKDDIVLVEKDIYLSNCKYYIIYIYSKDNDFQKLQDYGELNKINDVVNNSDDEIDINAI
jgi:translation initiation factor IF-1